MNKSSSIAVASMSITSITKLKTSDSRSYKSSSIMDPPVNDCAAYALLYPAKHDSPICLEYGPTDSYKGANARCFCQCAGDSAWSKFVRACLRCMYREGVDGSLAHTICYDLGDRLAPGGGGRPWGTLAACAIECWLAQLGTHLPDQTLMPDLQWPFYPDAP